MCVRVINKGQMEKKMMGSDLKRKTWSSDKDLKEERRRQRTVKTAKKNKFKVSTFQQFADLCLLIPDSSGAVLRDYSPPPQKKNKIEKYSQKKRFLTFVTSQWDIG